MVAYDENVVRLLVAAKNFVSKNNELTFSAETVAKTALKVAGGDIGYAEELLQSMEEFSRAALLKLRSQHYKPPLSCVPFSTIQRCPELQPSNDVRFVLLDRLP